MSVDNEYGSDLVERSREDFRKLQKMRSKLVTSGQTNLKLQAPPKSGKSTIRIWPLVVAAILALAGLNYALFAHSDQVLKAMGADKGVSAKLALPPGLSLDDQARFWAYSVYDVNKLRGEFKVPKGVAVNLKECRLKLDLILAENLGPEVRAEINAYQVAHPDPIPAATPVAVKKKR